MVQKVAAGGLYPSDPNLDTEGTPKVTLIITSTAVGPVVTGSPR